MGDSQERPLTRDADDARRAAEEIRIRIRILEARLREEEEYAEIEYAEIREAYAEIRRAAIRRRERKTHEEALASPATTSTMAAAVPAPDLLPSQSENGNLLLPNPTGSPPQEPSSSEKLNEEHEVNNVVVPPKSAMATMDRVLDVIKSTMTCADMVTILEKHGCHDLTSSLDEPACSRYPIANGGLGDVFDGRLLNGTSVAIKTIRAYYDKGQLTRIYHKRAAREIYTWSKCKHPNVIELMGIAVFRDCLAMVSRWEENGSLLQYLSRHSSADRCQLSTSICAGLTYLHTNDIVHGDLKGANVLIGQDGQPMLMDFGNATLIDATLQFTQTNTGISFSLRWTAPEQLEGTAAHTSAGDIYALGMTILETFTSEVPFADKAEKSLLMYVVVHKNKPTRPESIIPKRSISGDVLWDILTKCWAYDPADRPTAETVWNSMKPLTPDQLKEIED